MARKRKDLGEVTGAQIVLLMQRGGTAESISKALGISRATAGRRMRELKRTGTPATTSPEPIVTEIPVGASAEVLEDLLVQARQGLQTAQRDGNLAAMGTMGRLIAQVTDQQRKAAPVPVADPNEHPDMKALAAQVAKRMHELVDQVTNTINGSV